VCLGDFKIVAIDPGDMNPNFLALAILILLFVASIVLANTIFPKFWVGAVCLRSIGVLALAL
jgi:hypothetical protein